MQQILKSLLLAICFLNSYSVYGSSSEEPGFEARELLSHPQTSTAHNLIINRKPYEQADAMDTIVAEIHRLESTDERIKNAVSNIKSILGTFTGKGDLHSIFLHYNYIINTIGGNAIFF
ncbi:hypothetical protein EBU95_21680, partial [bacterium]|nr:hypothetical protein [bacterium]